MPEPASPPPAGRKLLHWPTSPSPIGHGKDFSWSDPPAAIRAYEAYPLAEPDEADGRSAGDGGGDGGAAQEGPPRVFDERRVTVVAAVDREERPPRWISDRSAAYPTHRRMVRHMHFWFAEGKSAQDVDECARRACEGAHVVGEAVVKVVKGVNAQEGWTEWDVGCAVRRVGELWSGGGGLRDVVAHAVNSAGTCQDRGNVNLGRENREVDGDVATTGDNHNGDSPSKAPLEAKATTNPGERHGDGNSSATDDLSSWHAALMDWCIGYSLTLSPDTNYSPAIDAVCASHVSTAAIVARLAGTSRVAPDGTGAVAVSARRVEAEEFSWAVLFWARAGMKARGGANAGPGEALQGHIAALYDLVYDREAAQEDNFVRGRQRKTRQPLRCMLEAMGYTKMRDAKQDVDGWGLR